MFNKEFDDWFKGEMLNTHKGVEKEKLESFVYDTAMAAWQARVPEGYVVVHVDKLMDCLYQISDRSYVDDNVSEIKAMIEAVEK